MTILYDVVEAVGVNVLPLMLPFVGLIKVDAA